MRRRPLVRSQGAMRTAWGVAVHHTVSYSGVTTSNLGGTATSGPFPPTAPETYALWALCNEYAFMHVLCTPTSRKKFGLEGYDEAVARPFARARSRARPRRERRACAGPSTSTRQAGGSRWRKTLLAGCSAPRRRTRRWTCVSIKPDTKFELLGDLGCDGHSFANSVRQRLTRAG